MKTKRTILSVFMTLAMVVSLCAVAAVPAAAAGELTLEDDTGDDATGPVGGTVKVIVNEDAAGFPGGEPLTVEYDGTQVDTTPSSPETSESGNSTTNIYFKVPDSKKGNHTVEVFCGIKSETATYTVEPKVSIADHDDQKGSKETVTCTGFAANRSIDVYAVQDTSDDGLPGDGDDSFKVGSGSTDSKGTAEVTCTMDHQSYLEGVAHEAGWITAGDGAGNEADWPDEEGFEFRPGITLDPTTGSSGETVTVEASGFNAANTTDLNKLKIAANVIEEVDTTDITDEDNEGAAAELLPGEWVLTEALDEHEFEVKFQIPTGLSTGTKTVSAETNQQSATATFTVGEATMEIDPVEGPVGQTVSVDVSGLAADKADFYDLYFDGGAVREDLDSDSDGNLSTSFEVPSDAASGTECDVELTHVDDEDDVFATATYEVIELSLTASPEEGFGGTEVTLEGEGYEGSKNYSIVFEDSAEIRYVLKNISTTKLGYFETTVSVPAPAAIGDGEFYLAGDETKDTKAEFEVTAPPTAVEVEEGLSIGGVWDNVDKSVWYFDNSDKTWSQYYKDNPGAVPEERSLEDLRAGEVYWISVSQDCTLKYGGETKSLTEGWNLISWP
ncbi:MAG: hypothetical protein ACOC6S_03030 [Chloroflexota bacterium]